MKSRKSRILRTPILIIVGIYIGFTVYLYNAQSIVGNALPTPFGYGASVVLSGSMQPALEKDDLIIVKDTTNVSIDDIVVYQDGYELIVHRVVSIDEDNIYTKGDANGMVDDPITKENIKGKVICSIPFVGAIINVMKHPLGTISVLLLAFLLLEMSYAKEKQIKQEDLETVRLEIERLKQAKAEREVSSELDT
ncbi:MULTISPECIES: signal peptidase I [Breznakia]|uniref:Signal peptidase I n=1 Tax=Breznakia blatticola TaxID=1754012 RepID=A0A4R7ZR57_9FIRM|nr:MULTISPECIES: signal peptidase I [Breznakia]MDH6367504.1 signal peptidase I [Breznakia sp. PH1-1]MDH6404624.1 signal peptidase I [Breznakia sp. PF1-11]MDH6412333.1 signal peptidase I [Breznakia sp. PFB1-11]MDH6414671.1 signal peptidase I [Breznakia sp. PFB1-14]MDH6416934.1 signal peptidase I [Breznakia sp. PFB1-4]